MTVSEDSLWSMILTALLYWLHYNSLVCHPPTQYLPQSLPEDDLATLASTSQISQADQVSFPPDKSEDDKCYCPLVKVFLQNQS